MAEKLRNETIDIAIGMEWTIDHQGRRDVITEGTVDNTSVILDFFVCT